MAFCEFSSEVVSSSVTSVENTFISDYLPFASGDYVKVYLYGLYKCSTSRDNDISSFAKSLQMSEEDILSVFYYWQEAGLVNVINVDPVIVRYLPIKSALKKLKKYNVDKYTEFNLSAQELMGSKMLTPRELEEFYYIIENLHMEKDALLRVIDYCVKQKGGSATVSYVVAVAKNWVYDGVFTIDDVSRRLETQERVTGDVVLVLKALGIKRSASLEEYQMYLNWTEDFEMPLDLIVHIAKKTKSKNFAKLNAQVSKCYAGRLLSIKEVDDFLKKQDELFDVAKTVVRNMGLWYDNLENVVDTYISNWFQLGFDKDAIISLSNYAFRKNIRNLDGLNNIVNNMFKLGLLTNASIDNYMQDIVKNDGVICQILGDLGIERGVIAMDRTMYRTWLYDWNMGEDIINYAISLSKGKYSPMQHLNRVLSEYHSGGVKSVDDAKKFKLSFAGAVSSSASKSSAKDAKKREYSKKELDSLFDNVYEIEI